MLERNIHLTPAEFIFIVVFSRLIFDILNHFIAKVVRRLRRG